MRIFEMLTITEASIAVSALAFVFLVIVLAVTSIKTKRACKAAQNDLHRVSIELSEFISKLNEKSDVFFDSFIKTQLESEDPHADEHHVMPKISLKAISWILSSLLFFKKTKQFMRRIR